MKDILKRFISVKIFILALLSIIFVTLGLYIVFVMPKKTYLDMTVQTAATQQVVPAPRGSYASVVWLTEDQIVFFYADQNAPPNGLRDHHLFLYTRSKGTWEPIHVPQPSTCTQTQYGPITRLPNGTLGIGFTCVNFLDRQREQHQELQKLYSWDVRTGIFRELYEYDAGMWIGPFTFSPTMETSILENSVGPGYHNQLYWKRIDGSKTRLFADYERVRHPSWSPNGQYVAFLGTKNYTLPSHQGLLTWAQMGDRLFYPWDMYLLDTHQMKEQIILTGIKGDIWSAGWSPDSQTILFRGTYQNDTGIWAVNIATQQVTRIWASATASYLSPNGTQMVLIQQVQVGDTYQDYPLIVDLLAPR